MNKTRPPVSSQGKIQINVKRTILLLAKHGGLFALARILTARKTRILAYHGIWLGEGHFGNFLYMSAEKFAARMALLDKWQYPVISLSEVVNGNKNKPRCATAITIDDGWYGTWSAMLPVLERHNYPATVYLTTYYCLNQQPVIDVALQYCFHVIDAKRVRALHLPLYNLEPMFTDTDQARKKALAAALNISASLDDDAARQKFLQALCAEIGINHAQLMAGRWFHLMAPEEVKDAAKRGITFESHTHHHRIDHHATDCLAEEISINREHINSLAGRIPQHFCYPSGRFSSALWPILEMGHMASATTTDIGLVDDKTPKYALPRILDGHDVSELELEAEMSGFMELSRRLLRIGKR